MTEIESDGDVQSLLYNLGMALTGTWLTERSNRKKEKMREYHPSPEAFTDTGQDHRFIMKSGSSPCYIVQTILTW